MNTTTPSTDTQIAEPEAPKNREVAATLRSLVDQFKTAEQGRPAERLLASIIQMMEGHVRNWSPRFCRVGGDVYGQHLDDIYSVSMERIITMLREARDTDRHLSVENWYSYLYGSCRHASLAYFHSSEVTAASGMTSAMRRQRHVARIRADLRSSLHREPTDVEIIEAANANMRARRANPEKQGALVDLSDLRVLVQAVDIADHDQAHEEGGSAVLTPVEGRMLVSLIVEACEPLGDDVAAAARCWIGGMYAEPPHLGTASEIAAECGVSPQRATRLIALVRDVARDVANRRFGITFPG